MDRTEEVSSSHCFEPVDRTDEVSSKHGKSAQNSVLRLWIELKKSAQVTALEVADRTDEVSNIYTAR
ncbi:hypothetical protein [Streptococcus pneumoniae]|uniref:hypothetical protein n=1 Tax=Streptococcus pneumoniae TaxID=1313 RepID=UPI00178552C5|nr:hypothetical protein [Streptococcus pneumoniae]